MRPDNQADEEAVKKWVEAFFAYMGSNDLDKFTSLMADDIVLLPPNMHSLHGIEAMKELIQPWFETLEMSHDIFETEIVTDDNLAYVRIEYRDYVTPLEGGDTKLTDNKGLWILRRETDDKWKATRIMWNRNPSSEEHP